MAKYSDYYDGPEDLIERLTDALDHYLQGEETAAEMENVMHDAMALIEDYSENE